MDVVSDADSQLCLASTLNISFGLLSPPDLVLSNSVGETC